MRAMQVIYCLGVGGSESVARDIALNMTGNVVHGVAALEADGPLRQTLAAAGVSSWVINRQPDERVGPMLRLWKAMREFKPDVVHTHHLYELFYAWPGALLTGARLVHTEHEYYSLMSAKACFLLRQLARFCQAVTGVNEETSAFLREEVGIPAGKVHTVVNGIDLERYAASCRRRQELGLADSNFVVAIVARLEPVKDHAMLVQAFRLVVDKLPQAKLLIIGDGSERQNLERLADELGLGGHIRFLGCRSDVADFLACVDVVALSSKAEGLPLCILEAMAAGKPVVATEVGGIPTVVRPGETGLLVPAGDHQAMATALLAIRNDAGTSSRMGERGRRLVAERYDLKKTIEAYVSLYKASVA